MLTRKRLQGPTIKAALLTGFGLTFGIWLFAGYYFSQRMADVEERSTAINMRYVQAQDRLATIRAQLLLGSVFVRDALLDPDPSSVGHYRQRLDETYRAVDKSLTEYVPVLDSTAERQRLARLQAEIDDFRDTLRQVLASDSRHWPTEARTLLKTRIVPKRELAIRMSEDMQALNRGAFVQRQAATADVYGLTQRHVWQSLGGALAASLGIAIFAILYAGRLEDRIRRQQAIDEQNTRDLQHLSAKLINAQEEERRTIARELHDEVGQLLTTVKVELALAERSIDTSGGPTHVLESARTITDSALHAVRDLSHLLHPSLLDDLGLAAAVDSHLKGFGQRHRLHVELLQDGMEDRLPPETEASAYRIVQEALTNVARHAQATACRVYVQRLPRSVLVTIEDDGVGFDAADVERPGKRRGLGLVGIRERAGQLRGTVRLESAPGRGTRLTVELPARVRAAAEGDEPLDAGEPAARSAELEAARG